VGDEMVLLDLRSNREALCLLKVPGEARTSSEEVESAPSVAGLWRGRGVVAGIEAKALEVRALKCELDGRGFEDLR
jgi:hypothetical protein